MSEPQARRRLLDNPWVRRLPLLFVAAIGFFFFLPKVPHDVEVDYALGRAAKNATKVDVELIDDKGRHLHRTVFNQPGTHVVQHARLPKGDYRAELELQYPDRNETRVRSFTVGEETVIDLDVEQP